MVLPRLRLEESDRAMHAWSCTARSQASTAAMCTSPGRGEDRIHAQSDEILAPIEKTGGQS